MRVNALLATAALFVLICTLQSPAPIYEAPELTTFVDLRSAANAGLADDQLGDRKGGWTDQGNNDMAWLPVGVREFAGVPFDVIDPNANGGRACIMLMGREVAHYPRESQWIKVGRQFEYLYLLHGVAWVDRNDKQPYAHVEIQYDDDRTVQVPLRIDQEANDWHLAKPAPNGPLAWIGRNDTQSPLGLHLLEWKNPNPEKFVSAIRFTSQARLPVPGFIAVTVASQKLEIKGPNRELRRDPIESILVQYRARMPLAARFGPAAEKTVTVHRSLPEQAQRLRSLRVDLRLVKTQGSAAVTIGGQTIEKQIGREDWVTSFAFDHPKAIDYVKNNLSDFAIDVKLSGEAALGRYDFDTSPNVLWTVGGEDLAPSHSLYGITFTAFFNTADPDLARWKVLELPRPPRENPATVTDEATTEPLAAPPAEPRASLCLNGLWQLASAPPDATPQTYAATARVPGVWQMSEGLAEKDAETHSMWYRTSFLVPATFAADNRVILDFGQVAYRATVYLNGQKIGEHLGDIDDFHFDVTDAVKRDADNDLVVCVEDHHNHFKPVEKRLTLDPGWMRSQEGHAWLYTMPHSCGGTDKGSGSTMEVFEDGKPLGPAHTGHQEIREHGGGRFSHVGGDPETLYLSTSDNTDPRSNGRTYEIRYQKYVPDRVTQRLDHHPDSTTMEFWSGILGDVYLRSVPARAIADVFVTTSVRNGTIAVQAELAGSPDGTLTHEVWEGGQKVLDLPSTQVEANQEPITVRQKWTDPHRWDIDDPHLYQLRTEWRDADGTLLDRRWTPFGFRELWIAGTDFVFNGRKIRLQGTSPSIPHYTTPMHHRLKWLNQMQIYRYMNANHIRLHLAGMNCPSFVEATDAMGLLATLEAPFVPWDWVWDEQNQEVNYERLEPVVDQYHRWARRFRNHPSLIFYSLHNEFWARMVDDPKQIENLTKQTEALRVLNEAVMAEDPSRLTQLHGSEGCKQHGYPWLKVTNMHYQWKDEDTRNWQEKVNHRPLIIGEIAFEGTWSFFNSGLAYRRNDPPVLHDFYWEKIHAVSKRIATYIDLYRARDISGIMPYAILQWATDADDPRGLGHDPAALKWPALSGPGPKGISASLQYLDYINWFDSRYPKAPQSFATDTVMDHFESQPLPPFGGQPEIIVLVKDAGNPLANVPVVLYPAEDQGAEGLGSVTDPEGKAWIVVPEYGRYHAVLSLPNRAVTLDVAVEPAREFSAVKTVVADVGGG